MENSIWFVVSPNNLLYFFLSGCVCVKQLGWRVVWEACHKPLPFVQLSIFSVASFVFFQVHLVGGECGNLRGLAYSLTCFKWALKNNPRQPSRAQSPCAFMAYLCFTHVHLHNCKFCSNQWGLQSCKPRSGHCDIFLNPYLQ